MASVQAAGYEVRVTDAQGKVQHQQAFFAKDFADAEARADRHAVHMRQLYYEEAVTVQVLPAAAAPVRIIPATGKVEKWDGRAVEMDYR